MKSQWFKIDIQLFADKDDKTEKPTAKKRRESREEGQVLQSREISSAVILLLAFAGLKLSGSYMYEQLLYFTEKVFVNYTIKKNILESGNLWPLVSEIFITLFKIVIPIFGIVLIAGLVSNYAQVGFLFTTKTLKPKFGKLNPINGFKRLFSMKALMEMLKAIFKIVIAGVIAYNYIKDEVYNIINLMDLEIGQIAAYLVDVVFGVALRMALVLVILGIIDYIFQWRQHEKDLMMSKQEIKEEHKQLEGNPEIKAKIKQQQREVSMRRMMSDIPKADVVITNPTHFAIAIKYDAETSVAPIVLAKGQDYIALRIKEIAKENRVEVVENKPLARALYSSTEIGEQIPAELFQAVAEVLAFVYSLR